MGLNPLNTQSDKQERDLAGILEEFRRKVNESPTEMNSKTRLTRYGTRYLG
jgi:hypothetical protein